MTMTDDLITMRASERREELAQAWDDGFSEGTDAGRGDEYSPNPYRVHECEVPNCSRAAQEARRVCGFHVQALTDLLAPRSTP